MKSKDYYWKIVSFVPIEVIEDKFIYRRIWVAVLIILFSLGLLFVSWRLAEAQYYRRLAMQSLKISNESKDRLFSIIAHDLKGPFSSLLGFSNMLEEELNEGDLSNVKKYSSTLNTTLTKTYYLLINLLDWSSSQTNRISFVPEKFCFNDLVDEIFHFLDLQAQDKEIVLKRIIDGQIFISSDRNMMSTVIRNLISNAIKYSNKGEIELKAYFINNDLYCSIKDCGTGISKEKMNTLFQISEIESIPGTNNEKGTGLGLMLCKEFIEKQNGEIGVESELGSGSVFWFRIPNSEA
ncbi:MULTISPECIES: sensor histidine kinase KdpD [unclassified Lentimicrobium]|uniref:sensor histidine kinase n=1 Tax=unclassified Lentimicrobium TaxID=2677434 RepID=UPI00155600B6|nr:MULTISPECIES: HAMP domain-containing sensor histidine kinase [unclassified Lentimicrobium]NPD44681.1 HAMP domain-containing histidine kinase [Lentimicrobium sp. S6]NPD86486.1 HAMP domain-containing histidine kinase [Lentimicrobium sp. L6]